MAITDTKSVASSFEAELRVARSVLIGTHMNPDGDTIGSALAVSHYLDGLGIANEVLCHNEVPLNLRFLPGADRIRREPQKDGYDLAIIVDLDSLDRLASTARYFAPIPRTIVVDHHVPHEAPGDLRIVDVAAPATSVILARLLTAIGADVTPEMATCLLTGIVTDTGSFRFRNTTPEALTIGARLIEAGGDINLVSEEIYHRRPYCSVKMLGHLLDTMHLECDQKLSWGAISCGDFQSVKASDADTEGFVNELLSIRTVHIAALLREHRPGHVRVSLRSRGEHDVSLVAREFGGGGHKNAAGCSFELPLSEAVERVVAKLRECLGYC